MTESHLQQAADRMPEPKLDYLAVEEAWKRQQADSFPRKKRRKAVVIVLLSLLLVGCVAGPTVPEYHLYNGSLSLLFPGLAIDEIADLFGADPEWKPARREAASLGWSIPEQLGGSPWCAAERANLTTKKSHYLLAMLFHTYTQYDIEYGYQKETEITREDGTHCTAHWTDNQIRLSFGSTNQEVWRRQFGFDERNVWVGFETSAPPESTFLLEYNGYTLYGSTFYDGENFFYGLVSDYRQYIHWVDEDHNTVFALYARADTPDFAISCAKELIDRMH